MDKEPILVDIQPNLNKLNGGSAIPNKKTEKRKIKPATIFIIIIVCILLIIVIIVIVCFFFKGRKIDSLYKDKDRKLNKHENLVENEKTSTIKDMLARVKNALSSKKSDKSKERDLEKGEVEENDKDESDSETNDDDINEDVDEPKEEKKPENTEDKQDKKDKGDDSVKQDKTEDPNAMILMSTDILKITNISDDDSDERRVVEVDDDTVLLDNDEDPM